MPRFGNASERVLEQCDERLVRVARKVVRVFDCSAIEGHRSQVKQDYYFHADPQLSKVKWPDSLHNCEPSKAIHLVPYPVNWQDRDRFHFFAGFVLAVANELGIPIRWGGDWDGDWEVRDNVFDDLAHFELRGA
jgi:hypothetical protein